MPVKKEITLYTYDELSQEAQGKAYDNWLPNALDYEWWDCLFDDFKEIGKIMGIEIDQIYFSGFASQGDGACFVGNYSYACGAQKNIRQYAPADKELHQVADDLFEAQSRVFFSMSCDVTHRGNYSHQYSVDMEFRGRDSSPYLSDAEEVAAQGIKEALRDFMGWMYKALETEYYYLTSEEQFKEACEANQYLFTEDGKISY